MRETSPRIVIELQSPITVGSEISIPAEEAHHLLRVLRLTHGSSIVVVDPLNSKSWSAQITDAGESPRCRIKQELDSEVRIGIVESVTLALLKGEHTELAIEKITELGVRRIVLFQAERSVVRLSESAAITQKLLRWQKVALSAVKQCKRSSVPKIEYFPRLTEVLKALERAKSDKQRFLICSLSAEAKPIRKLSPATSYQHLLIGPEGDFSPAEDQAALQFGFEPISLGANTLRAETAAIAAVAMAECLWG